MVDATLSAYERQREENVARNQAKLRELGLADEQQNKMRPPPRARAEKKTEADCPRRRSASPLPLKSQLVVGCSRRSLVITNKRLPPCLGYNSEPETPRRTTFAIGHDATANAPCRQHKVKVLTLFPRWSGIPD